MQQITGTQPSVLGQSAYPDAPPIGQQSSLFVCTHKNQQHFTYTDYNDNIQDVFWVPDFPWGPFGPIRL